MKSGWGGGIAPPFLTLALGGGEWSVSRSCRFTLRNWEDIVCPVVICEVRISDSAIVTCSYVL
jgi:hypothetical protein